VKAATSSTELDEKPSFLDLLKALQLVKSELHITRAQERRMHNALLELSMQKISEWESNCSSVSVSAVHSTTRMIDVNPTADGRQ
jgi:hypothetical protein